MCSSLAAICRPAPSSSSTASRSGSTREPIGKGAYVHTHNLRSDYIPTWDRTGAEMR
jgi:hypothetical protein